MTKYRVVSIREETPAEAAQRKWFEKQVLAAPDNLEAAARQIIGLVTGLLGVLFGVLAVASDPLPAYLSSPGIRGAGVASVVLLLLGLVTALIVVLPSRITVSSAKPEDQAAAFNQLLQHKSRALRVAVIAFALGLIALGVALVLALFTVA